MKIHYTCDSCTYFGHIESDNYETETECSEEGMGPKVEYWTNIEFDCEGCQSSISTTMNQTEYPEGNFSECSFDDMNGATFR